jgi:hypothetical protein
MVLKFSAIGSLIFHINPVSKTQIAPKTCAKQVLVAAVGERNTW